jgi:hypothetical protein
LVIFLSGPVAVLAQKEKDVSIPLDHFYVDRKGPNFLRILLSKLNFGLSTGYSSTVFKHELDGFGILQRQGGGSPSIFNASTPTNGYTNWFNGVSPATLAINPGDFTVTPADGTIGFRSKSFSIPLRGTLHVEFNRFRIGGGYSFDFMHVNDFKPLSFEDNIRNFEPDISGFTLKKYFLLVGASVYRYEKYLLTADVNIGGYKLGNKFDNSIIDRSPFFNLGATVEREMSEYFKLFMRPSYELKSYNLAIIEAGRSIRHGMNAFTIHIGATYRIPELPRCFIKECSVQINHAHGNREYRSRVHPIYKTQNPHYGENYPRLIKYKGKNKRKLNPY